MVGSSPTMTDGCAARLQGLEHDEGVDVAGGGVVVGGGEAGEGCEAAGFPEGDGAGVGGNHEIELDGAVPAISGVGQRVLAHGAGDAAAGGGGGCHVAAIGDMGAAAGLVRADVVCANDFWSEHGNEDLMRGSGPVGEGGGAGHVAGQRVGFARADRGLQDLPDGVVVGLGCGADEHGRLNTCVGRH